MGKTASAKGGKGRKGYVCGTPADSCSGSLNKNGGNHKVHRTREEARACYIRWLKSKGGVALKSGQLLMPATEKEEATVLLVGKKSKYGLRLKSEGPKGSDRLVKHHDSECFIV